MKFYYQTKPIQLGVDSFQPLMLLATIKHRQRHDYMLCLCFFERDSTVSHAAVPLASSPRDMQTGNTCIESLKSAKWTHKGPPPHPKFTGLRVLWVSLLMEHLLESPNLSSHLRAAGKPSPQQLFHCSICCWQRRRGLASPKPPCIPQKGTFPRAGTLPSTQPLVCWHIEELASAEVNCTQDV